MDENNNASIPKFSDVVTQIQEHKRHKLSRYFKNHKWRVIFIIISIILLFICAFNSYPINGDLYEGTDDKPSTPLTTSMSMIGYISAQVFVTLLITVLGIETFMSRQELDKLKDTSRQVVNKEVNKNQNNLNFLNNLYNKIKKRFFNSYVVAVRGEGENQDLYNKIKKMISQLNSDQIMELVPMLDENNE